MEAIQSKRKFMKFNLKRLTCQITEIIGKKGQNVLDIEKVCKLEVILVDFRSLFKDLEKETN